MRKKIFFLVIFAFFASCEKGPPPETKKSLVWVSIAPYQKIIQRLAGPDIEVETIVPGQVDPHSFEPTSRQVIHMDRGLVWFRIGEPFEKKILPLLQKRNPQLVTLDLRDNIELITEEGPSCSHCSIDHQDRHIWMSPKTTQIQAIQIARTLQQVFPEKQQEIAQNLEALSKDLLELDAKIQALLSSSVHRTILVSHPAFGYFCKDYACTQLSVEYEGKDPRPKHIEKILAQATLYQTKIAIVLPQYNNKGAQILAEKLHIPVHMVDPYSSDYFETLLSLAHLIANTKQPSTP